MTEQETIKILERRKMLSGLPDQGCKWTPNAETIALDMAISALEEIQRYRAIGTVEEIKRMQKYAALAKKHDTIGKVIEACAEYEEIGTVEECWEAREKRKEKKPIEFSPCRSVSYYKCPVCGEMLVIGKDFCCNCGQALDWET